MHKSLIYTKVREARASHANWIRRAKHLIEGLPVGEEFIPINSTACHFGLWLYGEGMKYKSLKNLTDKLTAIEVKHNELHDIYLHIYKIFFVDTKPSWIMSLITTQRKEVSEKNRETAQTHFTKLQRVSDELMHELDNFETMVRAIPDAIFAEVM